MKITKTSSRTALRDIEELIAAGVIEQEEPRKEHFLQAKQGCKGQRAGLVDLRSLRLHCQKCVSRNRNQAMTKLSFEEALIEVWRQALVEHAKVVDLGKERYPVRLTPKRGLRQVDLVFDGNEIRG